MRPYLTTIRKYFILTNLLLLPTFAFTQVNDVGLSADFQSGICELIITDLQLSAAQINIYSTGSSVIIKNLKSNYTSFIKAPLSDSLNDIANPAYFLDTISKSEVDLLLNARAISSPVEIIIMVIKKGKSEPEIQLTYPDGTNERIRVSFTEELVERINP